MITSGLTALAAPVALGMQAEGQQMKVDASEEFAVRKGESRGEGPWLVQGQKAFSVKVAAADVGRRYSVLEIHTPPGRGPDLHVHLAQNEFIYVTGGRIGIQCGSDRHTLGAGDSIMAPLGVPHAFVTLGSEPATMLILFDPAGDMEKFFADYAPLVDHDGPPDMKRLNEAYTNHGMKLLGPPLHASSFNA